MKPFKLTSKSLIQSWLQVELNINERTLAEVLREMNAKFDSKYTHSRIREWERCEDGRGSRIPSEVRNYILNRVIKYVLHSNGISCKGISNAKFFKIVNQLT